MVIFDSAAIYVDSATSVAERIIRIDLIIAALETAALNSATTAHLSEYLLDDGQVKISSTYKDTQSIVNSILAFEKLKIMYLGRLNGRVFRLMDSKNFGNYNPGRR